VDRLPVVTLAADQVVFPVAGAHSDGEHSAGERSAAVPNREVKIDLWQRWNDYGIGLFRKGGRGELRQAEAAFAEVEKLGRGDGALNIARVDLREGRLDDAAAALARAATAKMPAYPWSISWFSGLVNKQNGQLDAAVRDFRAVLDTRFAEARAREFDFSKDFTALDELGQTLYEQAQTFRGEENRTRRDALLQEASAWFDKALQLDPEDLAAHYNLALIDTQLGKEPEAQQQRQLYTRYKPDDNARDTTVALHRMRNAAANHAAEPVVIYDLQRPDRYNGEVAPILGPAVQLAHGGSN